MTQDQDKHILEEFFGAYFHEDWQCDDSTTDAVVLKFRRDMSDDRVREVVDAIRSYIPKFGSDKELEDSLFYDLGCYYMPSGEGKTAREWLKGIAALLLEKTPPQVE